MNSRFCVSIPPLIHTHTQTNLYKSIQGLYKTLLSICSTALGSVFKNNPLRPTSGLRVSASRPAVGHAHSAWLGFYGDGPLLDSGEPAGWKRSRRWEGTVVLIHALTWLWF